MVVPSPPSEGRRSRMTQDDVLFGYRLQLFDLAARTTVSHACRTFGVHRSTYYRWKAQVDRQGLESSPGKWCRSSALSSSVMSLAAHAAMSSTSLSLLSREISFSDPRSF